MFSLSEALIVSAIITAIFYGILLVVKLTKHKHINIIREIFICILVFVTAFIMSMTVIPKIEITPENSISILKPYSHGNRVNFIPFSVFAVFSAKALPVLQSESPAKQDQWRYRIPSD